MKRLKLLLVSFFLLAFANPQYYYKNDYCFYIKKLEEDYYNRGGCSFGDILYYALIPPLEKASGLKASCPSDGIYYEYRNDSIFFADLYRWKKHFNCDYTQLDTLTICEKITIMEKDNTNASYYDYLPQCEKRSGLKAHYKMITFSGYMYENDSIFQADIKQWKDYFKCTDK